MKRIAPLFELPQKLDTKLLGCFMYVHHSFEDKLRSVELYESGLGSDSVGKALNIQGNQIRYWIRAYKQFGTEGLRKQRYHQPFTIFKCEVVKYVLEKAYLVTSPH